MRALKPVAQRGVEREAGLGAVLAVALGHSPTPLSVGRFSLQEKLGEGGMGSVFAAWDPELERRVALKFLHSGDSEREREHMLAEARVLARFSHPHVVTIYDVGVADRRVYFAMELVEAGSLDDWLDAHPDAGAPTLLQIFEDAARGLAAAHARGLVHRDFKPRNVLVGDDGRARVSDFGLATEDEGAHPTDESHPASPTERAGTPDYMSPQQRRGERVDARADQYSFARALERCLERLDGPALRGRSRRRLDALLTRALAEQPEDRFDSMQAVITELRAIRRPRRWRRRLALAALVLGGGVVAIARSPVDPLDQCMDGANALAVATDQQWPAITDGLSTQPLGTDALAVIEGPLRRYAQTWRTAWTDACRATWRGGTQSTAALDLRLQCLEQRRTHIQTVLEALTHPDESLAVSAPVVVGTLPEVDACARVDVLAREAPEPDASPQRVLEVRAAQQRLARARARFEVGDFDGLSPLLEQELARAERLDHAPTLAQALLLHATMIDVGGNAELKAPLRRSYVLAQRAGDDASAFDAALEMSSFAADVDDDSALAEFWADTAEAIAERMGATDWERLRVADTRGRVAMTTLDYAEAAARLDEASTLAATISDAQIPRFIVEINRAQMLDLSGHSDKALEAIESVLPEMKDRLGPFHPYVFNARSTHATIALGLERLAEARAAYEQLQRDYQRSPLPHTRGRIVVALNLGELERRAGRLELAETHIRTALALLDEHEGPARRYRTAYENLSAIFEAQGRYEEALDALRRSDEHLPAAEREQRPELVARSQATAGIMLTRLGRLDEAEDALVAAQAAADEGLAPEHIHRVYLANAWALLALRREDWTTVAEHAQRAIDGLVATDAIEPDFWSFSAAMLAEAHLELNQIDQAQTALDESPETSQERRSTLAWTRCLRARIAWARGDRTAAIDHARAGIEVLAEAAGAQDRERHGRCVQWRDTYEGASTG